MPIVTEPIRVRCRGRNGKAKANDAGGERDQHRVQGLREVERARAFDVAKDPAALGHHRRQGVEGGVEQDELGDRARRLAPGAHRDADVGVLQARARR